jgi:hypothetical protein
MAQFRIVVNLIVKDVDKRHALEAVREKIQEWFDQSKDNAPPFNSGDLLWFGFAETVQTLIDEESVRADHE